MLLKLTLIALTLFASTVLTHNDDFKTLEQVANENGFAVEEH